jgi:hypothetical protein
MSWARIIEPAAMSFTSVTAWTRADAFPIVTCAATMEAINKNKPAQTLGSRVFEFPRF